MRYGTAVVASRVNRELAALLRMFNLGRRSKLVDGVPDFEEAKLDERNTRKGFVDDDTLVLLFEELPEHIH